MSDDRETARRAMDLQTRGRDFALTEIPRYRSWSAQKLKQGESAALIAHLDATSMWLRPEDVQQVDEAEFEEMLADLKQSLDRAGCS